MSTLFSLAGLPTHPQNPHSWRTNLEKGENVDAQGNDGIASMTEQVKRPNTWRNMMMKMRKVMKNEVNKRNAIYSADVIRK